MRDYSLVLLEVPSRRTLELSLNALQSQFIDPERVEIIIVAQASETSGQASEPCLPQRDPNVRIVIAEPAASRAQRYITGAIHAVGKWICFLDTAQDLPVDCLRDIDVLLRHIDDEALILLAPRLSSGEHGKYTDLDYMAEIPRQISGCVFRKDSWTNADIKVVPALHTGFEEVHAISKYLLASRPGIIGWLPHVDQARGTGKPPPTSFWTQRGTYSATVRHAYLDLLEQACAGGAPAPPWLQLAILDDLQWYFRTDMRERAPTRILAESLTDTFHELMARVMEHIDIATIESWMTGPADELVGNAMMSYKGVARHSAIRVQAYDHDLDLILLAYYVHGTEPAETILADNVPIQPVHGKYRACNAFHRCLFLERLLWLTVSKTRTLELLLNDKQAVIRLPARTPTLPHADGFRLDVEQARIAFPPRHAAQRARFGIAGLKVRFVRWLAKLRPIRRRYANAWVFTDRDYDADDNAEHLYRWVRVNHPEINAWFLLARGSADWARLKDAGFRLVPQGWRRRLLLRNCDHVISSHADYSSTGFVRRNYGDQITWHFTFLHHGVDQHDQSHWFNGMPLDVVISPSAYEFASWVDDRTPYAFTTKEIFLTGFPRHDTLLAKAAATPPEEVNTIMVMPTWRASLMDDDPNIVPTSKALTALAQSDYVKHWGSLLRSSALRQIAATHDMRLVFMPHPDAVRYLAAFDLPKHVEVLTKADTNIQSLFCRSAVMITDYSSVAFEMAYIYRPVIYYQYDREQFFATEHVWRKGYFDYGRDGFGPVAFDESQLLEQLQHLLENGARPKQEYQDRMKRFFTFRDGQSCQRVFERILALKRPKEALNK